jgi:hypothetical protein
MLPDFNLYDLEVTPLSPAIREDKGCVETRLAKCLFVHASVMVT